MQIRWEIFPLLRCWEKSEGEGVRVKKLRKRYIEICEKINGEGLETAPKREHGGRENEREGVVEGEWREIGNEKVKIFVNKCREQEISS